MIVGGREGSPEEGSDGRWSGAMTGGGGCKAAIGGGGERSPVEESDRRWRGGITGGGERSQEKGSDHGWRGRAQVDNFRFVQSVSSLP